MTAAKKPPHNAEPVESLGQTWYLSKICQPLREAFAGRMLARAWRRLNSLKKILTEEEFAAAKKEHNDRVDAGAYDWGPPPDFGGTGPGEAIQTFFAQGNALDLIQLLLTEAHGELSLSKVGEIYDGNMEGVTAAYRAAMGLSPLAGTPAEGPGTTSEPKAETHGDSA